MANVGQELLAVPLPEMVLKLGLGIAEAQRALDQNSVETAQMLAETTIPLVMAVTQVIAADGTVSFTNSDPVDVSLLQIGLLPTFYQFSEATIGSHDGHQNHNVQRDKHQGQHGRKSGVWLF